MDPGPEVLALLLPEVVLPAEVVHHLVDVGEVGKEDLVGGHSGGWREVRGSVMRVLSAKSR